MGHFTNDWKHLKHFCFDSSNCHNFLPLCLFWHWDPIHCSLHWYLCGKLKIIWVGKYLIFKSFYEHSKLLENPNSQLSKLEFKFRVLRMSPNFHLMWEFVCILLHWPEILAPFAWPIPTWKSWFIFILR